MNAKIGRGGEMRHRTSARAARSAAALALLLALASCGRANPPPPGWPGAPGNPTPYPAVTRATAAFEVCVAELTALDVRFTPTPDRIDSEACRVEGAGALVADMAVRNSLSPGRPVMTCRLARDLTGWRRDLDAIAREILGAEVQTIDHYGVYACRTVSNRPGARMSAHSRAEAIDIAGFRLTDGRRITVAADWSGEGPGGDEGARFLRAVRDAGCRRFGTVLSPDYDAAHQDHLHLEPGGRLCR